MNIPGLPEGVECVRIGRAKPEDFEIIAISNRHCICKALRQDSLAQIIVQPAPGWAFVPADLPSALSAEFIAVAVFPAPVEIVVSAKFSVTNSREQQIITDAADLLATLPGYVVP